MSDPARHATLSDSSAQIRAIGTIIESVANTDATVLIRGESEIGEVPLALNAKLLHVLQDFRFSRIGGHGVIAVDSRVIAATNRNLEQAMARRGFREDLYYRVNVVEIRQKQLSPETMTHLQQHLWSGNVVRRLVVLADVEGEIEALVARGRNGYVPLPQPAEGLREIARRAAREAERKALADVLERVHWNRAEASGMLKVSYKTLLHRIVDYGLTPPPRGRSATSGAASPYARGLFELTTEREETELIGRSR